MQGADQKKVVYLFSPLIKYRNLMATSNKKFFIPQTGSASSYKNISYLYASVFFKNKPISWHRCIDNVVRKEDRTNCWIYVYVYRTRMQMIENLHKSKYEKGRCRGEANFQPISFRIRFGGKLTSRPAPPANPRAIQKTNETSNEWNDVYPNVDHCALQTYFEFNIIGFLYM